jgi:hypothetical protein
MSWIDQGGMALVWLPTCRHLLHEGSTQRYTLEAARVVLLGCCYSWFVVTGVSVAIRGDELVDEDGCLSFKHG